MDLIEWRKARSEGEPFVVPSGLVVHLRRVQLLDLAGKGQIPAPLLAAANGLLTGENTMITADDAQEKIGILDLVVGAALAGPEGLDVQELPVSDKLAIYEWVNQPLAPLRPFRPEPEGTGEPGRDGGAV
jgi:hypothetical protein